MSFGGILKQSTAVNVIVGPFVSSSDGDTEMTGLTVAQADVRLSKNAAADAQKNDNTTCAHEGDGFYMCELDATDTNTVGLLTLWVHVATALAVRHDFQVVEEAVYDALYGASAVGPLLANATGTGLSAIPWNAAWDAEVQSEVTDGLNAYDPPTNTEMEARTIAAASYATAAALTTVDIVVDGIKAVTDLLPDAGALTSLAQGDDLADAQAAIDLLDTALDSVLSLLDDARGEPGQGNPSVNPDAMTKIDYLYKAWRNKKDNDGTETKLYADNGSTVDHKQSTSESGGTVTKGEWATGA